VTEVIIKDLVKDSFLRNLEIVSSIDMKNLSELRHTKYGEFINQ
jgi:hypothetical protein